MKQYIDPNGQPFASLAVPVWRASTVVFDTFEDFANRKSRQPDGYSYGLTGNPTSRELERRIAALENGNPVWKKRNCYMCLRCINCCPTEAIEYGKNTASRKRYSINKFVKYIFYRI